MRRHCLLNWLGAFVLSVPLAASAAAFSNMYVFGDSLSDNGNLYAWTGAPNAVTQGTPIPIAPPYAPGRFQNGPSYAELLWRQLGFAGDLQPSFIGGTNYAVGGARSRYHNFDLQQGLPPTTDPSPFKGFSLLGQLEKYKTSTNSTADPNALYVVWGGSNDLQDVLTLFASGQGQNAQDRLKQAVADLAFVVHSLVDWGARELLVPTVPDIGLVPAVSAQGSQAKGAGTSFSELFNSGLDQALADLAATPDLDIVRYDAFDVTQELFNNPSAFGLTNSSHPCLGNFYVSSKLDPSQGVTVCEKANEHMFWDIVHPSARTHEVVAQGMRVAVPEPGSFMLVAISLAVLVLGARRSYSASA